MYVYIRMHIYIYIHTCDKNMYVYGIFEHMCVYEGCGGFVFGGLRQQRYVYTHVYGHACMCMDAEGVSLHGLTRANAGMYMCVNARMCMYVNMRVYILS
jgi:hypothetical protein